MPLLGLSLLLLSCAILLPYLSELDTFFKAIISKNWETIIAHPFLILVDINLLVGLLTLIYFERALTAIKLVSLVNAGYLLFIYWVWHDYLFFFLTLLAIGSLLFSVGTMQKRSAHASFSTLANLALCALLASLAYIYHVA